MVLQTFPGRNYFFFPDFSRHFVHLYVNKTLQNWLLNAELSYTMYSSTQNTEWGLKFLNFELQMLSLINCKKTNKFIGNQQCNRHLNFPGEHYSFQGFSQSFPYLRSFSRLFKALKKTLTISTLNSRTFHTFSKIVSIHIKF